jgi:hypothetical protein
MWYEAEVIASYHNRRRSSSTKKRSRRTTSSKPTNLTYMIRYIVDGVVEKINIQEHLIRLVDAEDGAAAAAAAAAMEDKSTKGNKKEEQQPHQPPAATPPHVQEEEGKVLSLKQLVFEGLARPGENRLVCLSGGGTTFHVLSLLSDGRVRHRSVTYETMSDFLVAMKISFGATQTGGMVSSGSSGSTGSTWVDGTWWRNVRYRLPNARSVCLGRLRQVGIDLDRKEREKNKKHMRNPMLVLRGGGAAASTSTMVGGGE